MNKQTKPLSRKTDVVVQQLKDEVLIYDLKENKAFCLNETSALIWQMCDGNKSVSQISQSISKKLNSPANEDFVWLALDQLRQDNLLANGEEITPDFNGLSRREVIRKVGLGTMVALPIISGLVAPTSAQAQSPVCNQACACRINIVAGGTATVGGICADLALVTPCPNADACACVIATLGIQAAILAGVCAIVQGDPILGGIVDCQGVCNTRV